MTSRDGRDAGTTRDRYPPQGEAEGAHRAVGNFRGIRKLRGDLLQPLRGNYVPPMFCVACGELAHLCRREELPHNQELQIFHCACGAEMTRTMGGNAELESDAEIEALARRMVADNPKRPKFKTRCQPRNEGRADTFRSRGELPVTSDQDEFRRNAEFCRWMAERAVDPDDRKHWQSFAQHWQRMFRNLAPNPDDSDGSI